MESVYQHWVAYATTVLYILLFIVSLKLAEKKGILKNSLYFIITLLPPIALIYILSSNKKDPLQNESIHFLNYLIFVVIALSLCGITKLKPEIITNLFNQLRTLFN